MDQFEMIDFSSWQPCEGLAAGSGRSEKEWLISDDGKIGLFKYPKIDPACETETSEHVSEHLAAQLGKLINVETARVDLGFRNGRVGSMSYLAKKNNEFLMEGVAFISKLFPNFNADTMVDEDSGRYYCIDMIESSTKGFLKDDWVEMLLFDALIGNTDRHQSNWGILLRFNETEKLKIEIRRCPLYDNGSSLCSYVNENNIVKYFGRDPGPLKALVDTKSRSRVRIDGANKTLPTHRMMVKYLLENYSSAKSYAEHFVKVLDKDCIDNLMSRYPQSIISEQKNKLIRIFLLGKINMIRETLGEVEYEQ